MTRSFRTIRVFHRTDWNAAADIRIMGFHDAVGGYGTTGQHIGVWVSDVLRQPVDFQLIQTRVIEPGHGYKLWTARNVERLVVVDVCEYAAQTDIIRKEFDIDFIANPARVEYMKSDVTMPDAMGGTRRTRARTEMPFTGDKD